MTRVDDHFEVANATQDRRYSAQQLINIMDGGGGASGRTIMPATYYTTSTSPTVYITILDAADATTILTARTTTDVLHIGGGYYQYNQSVGSLTSFLIKWDEGDPTDFIPEIITIDL